MVAPTSRHRSLLRSLRELRVLVIHPADDEGRALMRQLQRIGCPVRQTWPPPERLPDDLDVVFFLVDHDRLGYRPGLADGRAIARIAIIAYEDPAILEAVIGANAHAVVSKPIRPFGILANLALSRAIHGYEQRLQSRVAKLDETLRTRRNVERATRILSSTTGISEDEAYAMIRRQAMCKRVTVSTIADSIVNAGGLLQDILAQGPYVK